LQTFGNIHIPLCMEGVHLRSRQGLTAHMWDYGAHVASGFFPMIRPGRSSSGSLPREPTTTQSSRGGGRLATLAADA